MEKIYLTKRDKLVFSHVYDNSADADVLPQEELYPTLKHLERLGLIELQYYQGSIRTARLTDYGRKYKLENPKLKNGVSDTRKWVVSTAVAILLALVTIIIQLYQWSHPT